MGIEIWDTGATTSINKTTCVGGLPKLDYIMTQLCLVFNLKLARIARLAALRAFCGSAASIFNRSCLLSKVGV
jgi:hypothetical protein